MSPRIELLSNHDIWQIFLLTFGVQLNAKDLAPFVTNIVVSYQVLSKGDGHDYGQFHS